MSEIEICLNDGKPYTTAYSATTFEISEGGLSAATANYLNIGDVVELSPVLGASVKAIVRRKIGAMYGFEFLGLTEAQRERIRALCEGLPSFQSMAGI